MKKTKLIYIAVAAGLMVGSCKQEPIKLEAPVVVVPPVVTPTKGSADFTKFVAIGNSLAAGYQAGALFTEGQNNSFPSMLAKQFALVGGGAFNQPTINSVNGYYGKVGPFVLGRLKLFDPDGAGPRTAAPTPVGTPATSVSCPSAVNTPAFPVSQGVGEEPALFAGNKATLNNFGVPGIQLGQILTPLTGGPSTGNSAYNGLYARFASSPGSSTILGDAIAAQPTFFLFELGANDILGYATQGGLYSPTVSIPGAIPLTDAATFSAYLSAAFTPLLGSNPNLKGVVANIPDVTAIPYFFTVTWNAITLDAATTTTVNTGFAGYNAALDGIKGNSALLSAYGLTASGLDARKVSFKTGGGNPILIADEDLTDLGGAFDALVGAGAITATQRAQLDPYRKVRQTTSSDLITLPAGGVLGSCQIPPGGTSPSASYVAGVSAPLADQYVLIPSETIAIKTRTAELNAAIKKVVDDNSTRLALADVNTFFNAFVTKRLDVVNGVSITPSLAPPTGGFSEDGVHPNSRGYAYMANVYIRAINTKFGSTLPELDISKYSGTGLPVNP